MSVPPEMAVRPMVVGADGLLGGHLARRLERRYPATSSTTRVELDLTDPFLVAAELERLAPTVVVNCAAWSDVDGCEREPERAMAINRDGPAGLARACAALGARLIQISTDYVFDGEKEGEYLEEDPTGALNAYGRSKEAGERAVLEAAPDSLVLRVSFLFGPGRPTWVDRIARAAAPEAEPVRAVDGWAVKPTYVVDLGEAIEGLLFAEARGPLHYAGGPSLTRYEFARQVMAAAGGEPGRVEKVAVEELSLPAARPRQSALSTERYAALAGVAPRPWTEGLAEYLRGGGRDPFDDED
jgi:dTDP-4-dehydrorhamnose reductase